MNKNTRTFNIVSKLSRRGLVILSIALFFSLHLISIVHAANITVNSTNDNLTADDNVCTLREAIMNANIPAGGDGTGGDCVSGDVGVDTITLPAGTYTLTLTGTGDDVNATGDLDITDHIIINGDGAGVTIIDGNLTDRVIHTHGSADMELNDLTVQNGTIAGNNNGGGIYHDSAGSMDLSYVDILDNFAGNRGGGLENGGTATLTNCTVSGNTSREGGGLVSATPGAVTTITDSAFYDNTASNSRGGGLNVFDGTVTVENSAFTGNHGSGTSVDGGGLANRDLLTVINSTISGNETTGDGNGIYTWGGTTTINNSTITDNNTTGYGIYNGGGAITLENSIVSGNGVANCFGTIGDSGNNLEYPSITCGGFTEQTDPLLGTLADNGGPTQTHALGAGSPAMDAGNNDTCETTDQRGITRPLDGDADGTATCDIGAFEVGELQCGIQTAAEPGVYSFFDNVSLNITDDGSNLNCLRATDIPWDHPNATSGGSGAGIETGKYWIINGLQSDQSTTAAADYTLDLTLPHTVTPDTDAKVCKYPGSQGGYGWDCFRTGSDSSTVWLNGITSLSDWAVGDQVGPTAVSLQSISATSQSSGWVVALFSVLMLAMGGLWLRRVKR